MKGYEWLNLVLVILLLFCCPLFLEAKSDVFSTSTGMTSCSREPQTIWLRNACHGGFVTLAKGRKKVKVIAQHRGVHAQSSKVELMKESCHDESAGFLGSVTTRLFSPHAQKYVCFNHRGKVLAKSRKSVERLGPLCMFLERAISVGSRHFVQFQSSYNPEWYLGFDGKRIIHRKRRSQSAHTLPRKMKRTRHHRKRRHKCDFSFSTGSFRSIENEFSGLIEHIRKQKLMSEDQRHQHRQQKQVKDLESWTAKTNTANDIFVEKVSKTSAYYYIESNDERYKPEDRRIILENDYLDEEDLIESKISFLNFKSNLKMVPLRKKKSVSSSSNSSPSKPKKRRERSKLRAVHGSSTNINSRNDSPTSPSHP